MKAQVLTEQLPTENSPLELRELPEPEPGRKEVLVKISACGVCHTELDEIEGRLKPVLPVVPGHEVIGRVERLGPGAGIYQPGARVGIAWIYSACGRCKFCLSGLENLCASFKATGCDANGGYAQYMIVREEFAYPIPPLFTDAQAAPLLCAGAIGYRDLRLSGIKPGQNLGLYGFGASAHIVLQMALHKGCRVFVFTRGEGHRRMALDMGAEWAGGPQEIPPSKLDAAIDFTPVGQTVPAALAALEKGGRLVIAVIRKRDPVPPLDYAGLLWDEKETKSVANITRQDVREFLELAAGIPIVPKVEEFPLAQANQVLLRLKQGKVQGAAVLTM